jgi:hypothetical protein
MLQPPRVSQCRFHDPPSGCAPQQVGGCRARRPLCDGVIRASDLRLKDATITAIAAIAITAPGALSGP